MLSENILGAMVVEGVRTGSTVDRLVCRCGLFKAVVRGFRMPDVLSFAEVDGLQVELLPIRTVLSRFSAGAQGGGDGGHNGGAGGLFSMMSEALGGQINSAGNGVAGTGGSAHAGDGG